jgi:hypothetical protein
MILMQENPFRGPLKWVGSENQDFLVPELATSKASAFGAKKGEIFRTNLFQWPE